MTETDQNIQSSGLFLLSLPIIATVLPLFGLQLRRLAKAGEFAPVAAMFLGFIGVGMICYARRKQGDAAILGSAAAVFVLFSGIGGFFLVSTVTKDSDSKKSRYTNRATEEVANPARDQLVDHDAIQKDHDEIQAQMQRQMEDMRRNSERIRQEAMETHRRAMENMGTPGGFSPPEFPRPNFPGPPDFPGSSSMRSRRGNR